MFEPVASESLRRSRRSGQSGRLARLRWGPRERQPKALRLVRPRQRRGACSGDSPASRAQQSPVLRDSERGPGSMSMDVRNPRTSNTARTDVIDAGAIGVEGASTGNGQGRVSEWDPATLRADRARPGRRAKRQSMPVHDSVVRPPKSESMPVHDSVVRNGNRCLSTIRWSGRPGHDRCLSTNRWPVAPSQNRCLSTIGRERLARSMPVHDLFPTIRSPIRPAPAPCPPIPRRPPRPRRDYIASSNASDAVAYIGG